MGKAIMKQKKIHSILLASILLLSTIIIISPLTPADPPPAVKRVSGYIFVNGEIADAPDTVDDVMSLTCWTGIPGNLLRTSSVKTRL